MIKIICIGHLKEKYIKQAVDDYKKRISKYTKIQIIELDNYNNQNIKLVLQKEAEMIAKHIENKEYIITLNIEGNKLTSPALANKMDKIFNTHSVITFIIGGSYGIDQSIKDKSHYSLSFSDMTFPHQLFRVMLLEQIYRSFKIHNNETYHK